MPQANNTLSPSVFAALLRSVAEGSLRAASLMANVQNDIPISFKRHSAKFTKQAPGSFRITFYEDAHEVGSEMASTPAEAKMLVLEYLVSKVQQDKAAA
jgi:hypothetical protein